MFSSLDSMFYHPMLVSGRTIFTITNKIAAPSSWALKVYVDLKAFYFRLTSVIREFLIHRHNILDPRRYWMINICLYGSPGAAP